MKKLNNYLGIGVIILLMFVLSTLTQSPGSYEE